MSEETVRMELVEDYDLGVRVPKLEPMPTNPKLVYWEVPKALYDQYWEVFDRWQAARLELDEVIEALHKAAKADEEGREYPSYTPTPSDTLLYKYYKKRLLDTDDPFS